MAVSKVIYGNTTLIDLTADTITAEHIESGYTAHGANGEAIIGTLKIATGISATSPTKTEYNQGDTLDLTGLVVTATYTDGTTEDVTSQCTFNPADGSVLTEAGTIPISITFGAFTASVNITVYATATINLRMERPNSASYYSNAKVTIGDTTYNLSRTLQEQITCRVGDVVECAVAATSSTKYAFVTLNEDTVLSVRGTTEKTYEYTVLGDCSILGRLKGTSSSTYEPHIDITEA